MHISHIYTDIKVLYTLAPLIYTDACFALYRVYIPIFDNVLLNMSNK